MFVCCRDWNSKNYIEPGRGVDEKEKELLEHEDDIIDDDRRNREASGLVRTGRLCGGLINDIKRKTPHYISDFTDGFHSQFIFIFPSFVASVHGDPISKGMDVADLILYLHIDLVDRTKQKRRYSRSYKRAFSNVLYQ